MLACSPCASWRASCSCVSRCASAALSVPTCCSRRATCAACCASGALALAQLRVARGQLARHALEVRRALLACSVQLRHLHLRDLAARLEVLQRLEIAHRARALRVQLHHHRRGLGARACVERLVLLELLLLAGATGALLLIEAALQLLRALVRGAQLLVRLAQLLDGGGGALLGGDAPGLRLLYGRLSGGRERGACGRQLLLELREPGVAPGEQPRRPVRLRRERRRARPARPVLAIRGGTGHLGECGALLGRHDPGVGTPLRRLAGRRLDRRVEYRQLRSVVEIGRSVR